MLAVTLGACANPANRRELYNNTEAKSGAWHDYTRRRQAEAQTGISAGVTPSALPGRGRPTAPPPGGPPGSLPPGSEMPALQAPLNPANTGGPAAPPPAEPAPAPAPVVPTDAGGNPAEPVTPGAQ